MSPKLSMIQTVASGLKKNLPAKLVDELLAAYEDAKQNFFVGGLRLSAVEGGRFCEAAFRILEHITTGKTTQLNKQLETEKLILTLSNLPSAAHSDSVRVHIPRALRVVYDIRNKRDAAHLADGIDPNLQDATLVVSVLDWITAEFVRIYHGVSADQAQGIIETLVTRQVPAVQDFDGFLKILNTQLKYYGDAALNSWAQPTLRTHSRYPSGGASLEGRRPGRPDRILRGPSRPPQNDGPSAQIKQVRRMVLKTSMLSEP